MSIASNMRAAGFKASLKVRGRAVTADTDESLCVLVQDRPMLLDPDKPAQKKKPVYSVITALAYSVKDPRAIEVFIETITGRVHTVFEYDETTGDDVAWKWNCETTREDFSQPQ